MRRRLAALVLACAAVAGACADDAARRAAPTTGTGATSAAPVEGQTTTTPAPPTTASPLSPIDGCAAPGPLAVPDPARPTYRGRADIDMASGRVVGQVDVGFTPDRDVGELVFRLWPNAPSLARAGTSSTVTSVVRLPTGEPLDVGQPDATTVIVATGPVAARSRVEVRITFEVIAAPASDRISWQDDTLRLGSFVPLLAWEPGVGWAREPATALFAESVTSPAADWELAVSVTEGYQVLATGSPGSDGVWRASGARDVALSVGHFDLVTETVALPGPVAVTVGVDRAVEEDPGVYLARVTAALGDFAARFGAYPWPTFTLAITPGLEGGIEFPAHVMQGPGTSGRTTPHEVGHMWFYALVGNDQGRDPWLDEGLASYAEYTHDDAVEESAARSIPADASGRGGEPMTYWESHRASYYRGVYLQPAVALAGLGPEPMVDCALRHYVAANAFGIATPATLFAALGTVFPDAVQRLQSAGLHP